MRFGNKALLNLGILLGLYTMLWWGCAQVGTLTGGEKDTQAPQIDSLKSTPNYQTNFKEKTFEITFDEWLTLKDVYNQVVVSPPLKGGGRAEVSLRKKTVVVDLGEEDLRPDATYIINFGEAITDFTVGNAVKNLRFVFSTGDYIDSLEMTGTIVDAFTGKPVEKCLFMLYDNLSDTVVRKDIPFYFSKTDELGNFKLQNIKADTFKTFALLSTDPNYRYDQASEQIGFLDSFIVLHDSARINLQLRIFQENPRLILSKKEKGSFGFYKFLYNQTPYEAQLTYDSLGQDFIKALDKDTLKIWYNWQNDQSWKVYLQQDTTLDTLVIDTIGKASFFANAKLKSKGSRKGSKQKINPVQGIRLQFNYPLKSVDTTQFFLLADTTKTRVFPQIKIDSIDQRKLHIQYPWEAGLDYQLQAFPGALRDIYGLTIDSLEQDFIAQSADDFGIFTINLTQMDSTQQYLFQLLKGDKVLKEEITAGQSKYQFVYAGLGLGSDYVVRLIEDRIPNGRWDTGSYDEKRQPERLRVIPLQELRANFESEETISGKF